MSLNLLVHMLVLGSLQVATSKTELDVVDDVRDSVRLGQIRVKRACCVCRSESVAIFIVA